MIDKVIYNFWDSELPELINRSAKIDLHTNLITDIVGPRRTGKTSLMFLAIKEIIKKNSKKSIVYINFEDRRLLPLQKNYFNQIIDFIYKEELIEKYKRVYLFLDEVQKIDKWERYVRAIFDEFKEKIKIVVSGSNSNLLSKEYGKLLTGRHLTMSVTPLSFKEFLSFKNLAFDRKYSILSDRKRVKADKTLNEYLQFGGFPEVVLEKKMIMKKEIINQLFTDILIRDIISRDDTRRSSIVEEFSYFLSSNVSTLLSFNKMAKYFKSRGIKISVATLGSYFNLMKNAFLFFDHTIFSYKIKDQLQYPRKIYVIDIGIANLVGFKFSQDLGRSYENAVAIALRREEFNRPNTRIFYWKSSDGREIDFVIKERMKIKQLIQVCFDLNNEKIRHREIQSLLKASDELGCNNLLIISKDIAKSEKISNKNITYLPLFDFLFIRP